jgi:CheY-like chemotaxis protein
MGDPLRIEQVLLNLCSNALKFTDAGSVSIHIASKAISNSHEEIVIRIKDSGIGISKEQQATLFQSFQQADNTTTRKYGGTGLGLAISKQLVELMGGNIVINSEIGKGCEFVIHLTLQKTQQTTTFNSQTIEQNHLADESADDADSRESEASVPEPVQKVSLQGVRVLLVEDIEINRMIATELLESFGDKVTQSCDGQQAVDTLKSGNDFDVVLMDIQMPVMDGLQATKVIRAIPQFSQIPILAMTANAMKEDINNCLAVGMNGHIAKPIDESHMVSSILASLPASQA